MRSETEPNEISLRPYQQDAVQQIRQRYRDGARSVLFVLPTGGGKTYVFSYIARSAASRGRSVLILAHRQELVMQGSLSLASIGVRHGLVCASGTATGIRIQHVRELGINLVDQAARVRMGSVQTVARRLDTEPEPNIIIIDEAHHATAGQWRQVIERWPNAKILGVTATPCRLDGTGLGEVFETMVLGPTVPRLIELGNLVPARVFFPGEALDLTGVRTTPTGDYNRTQLAAKIKEQRPRIFGDAVEHYRKLADGRPAVAFCASVEAAHQLAAEFESAGYAFCSLDGSMDDNERRKVVADLRDGKIHGITSCEIVSEGFDLPGLEVAIMLRPTKSLSLYLQQCGRVLRPADGKSCGIIIDHVGNVVQHGLPHWEREWTLEGVKKNKRPDGGPDIIVRTCPDCFAVMAPTQFCPVCGHEFVPNRSEIKRVSGDLQEITEEQERILKAAQRQQVGQARSLDALRLIEKQRGYKRGWADHVWRSRRRQ